MIGYITTGSDFAGLASYLYGPGHANEHVNPRIVGSGNVPTLDVFGQHWVTYMQYAAMLNRRVRKPVWHCSLTAAPDDRELSDQEWGVIAAEHMANMGLADHMWTAVRHGDNHVHIVVNRVDLEGKVWENSHDRRRSAESLRRIERRHGLTRVDENYRRRDAAHAKTSKAEREAAQRKGLPMAYRAMLRDELAGSLRAARGRGIAEFERELRKRGLGFRARIEAGQIVGYSVAISGWIDREGHHVWVRTSKVDQALAWKVIKAELETAPAAPRLLPVSPVSSIAPRTGL